MFRFNFSFSWRPQNRCLNFRKRGLGFLVWALVCSVGMPGAPTLAATEGCHAKLPHVSFPTATLEIANVKLSVEVAKTEDQHRRGLMCRKNLRPNHGMLFEFQSERILSFWMKNTLIPLSIGFFNSRRELIEVLDMQPASDLLLEPPIYRSTKFGLFALEVPLGWFKANKIKLNDRFKIQNGRLF